MFIITIKNLRIHCFLGVFDWEQETRRSIMLTIEMVTDTVQAGITDKLEDAVDYARVEQAIIQAVEPKRYALLEYLITDIAKVIFPLDERIKKITIEADKTGVLKQADLVSVKKTFER